MHVDHAVAMEPRDPFVDRFAHGTGGDMAMISRRTR
jgi:hypothetical protein